MGYCKFGKYNRILKKILLPEDYRVNELCSVYMTSASPALIHYLVNVERAEFTFILLISNVVFFSDSRCSIDWNSFF